MKCSAELPRSRMLKVRADISRGLKYGKKYPGKYSTLVIIRPGIIRTKREQPLVKVSTAGPGADSGKQNTIPQTAVKMAVLVRKKCGRAHRRNRLKRIVREFYRRNQDKFPPCEGVIFSLHSSVDSEKDFKQELLGLMELAGKNSKSKN